MSTEQPQRADRPTAPPGAIGVLVLLAWASIVYGTYLLGLL